MKLISAIGVLFLISNVRAQCNGIWYTIVSGDTFNGLTQRYSCSGNSIQAANPGVNANTLQIGSQICIPTNTDCYKSCRAYYTIAPGDTYDLIATATGCSSQSLQTTNSRYAANSLQVGTVLCIPSTCPATGGSSSSTGGSCTSYTIASGDTFNALTQRFGCTGNSLQAANPGLDPRALSIGSTICVPTADCYKCSTYATINSGDSYTSIANAYQCDLTTLQNANPRYAPTALQVGTVLCIPNPCVVYSNGAPVTGLVNGVFYCNGVAQASSTGYCGNLYYINGALGNGFAGSSFFCNGVRSGISAFNVCNGVCYDANIQPCNGQYGSTYYCNGTVFTDGWCGNLLISNGAPVTGIVGSGFFCNGVRNAISTPNYCNGLCYADGHLCNGNVANQMYCNGVSQGTAYNGLCNGIAYKNSQSACSTKVPPPTTTKSCILYAYADLKIPLSQFLACNGLSSTNCQVSPSTTYLA